MTVTDLQGVYVENDAADDPTIWLHNPDQPERPKALLSHCEFARLVGGDDDALPLWHRLTAGLPTASPLTCGFCGESVSTWPSRDCEQPADHVAAVYACDCGDMLTIADAIAQPSKHRRCNLIGANS